MNRKLKIMLLLTLISSNVFAQKIVFIAGPDSHGKGEHEHHGGSTLLVKAINEGLPGANAVLVQNGWPKDTTILNDAAAIVIYADGGGDHLVMPHLAEIDRLAKKGVGLVMLHFSLEAPEGKVGNYFKDWIGGYFEINWSVNPVWEAAFASFPDHPISSGVKPFSITDEWYYHMRFADDMKNITPILQALPPESTLKGKDGTHSNNPAVRESVLVRKELQPVAWAIERPDGGRGFGFSGGHMHKNWANDNFRKIVLNAVAWTAKATVPTDGIPSPTPTEAELNALTKKVD
jgi:type 1 glutamine amidotransferase